MTKLQKILRGLFLCSASFVFVVQSNDLIIEKPTSSLRSRQKLREQLGEILSDYMDVLVDNLLLIAQKRIFDNATLDQEKKMRHTYEMHLGRVVSFLQHGVSDGDSIVCDAQSVILQIARVQKELLHAFHCLLERDASSCFVACKAKVKLERFVKCAQEFVKKEREYQGYFKKYHE